MMTILYMMMAAAAVWAYSSRRYCIFMVLYFAIISQLFLLDWSGTTQQRCADICILINIALIPFVRVQSGKYKIVRELPDGTIREETANLGYSLKGDPFAIFIVVFILFYLLEFVITVAGGAETPLNAFKVVRISLLMLGYFVFRAIPVRHLYRFFDIGLCITLFQGLLFLLQFAGIHLIVGYDAEKVAAEGFVFALNIPNLTYFYIFYVLKTDRFGKWKYPIFIFLFALVLLTFVRAVLLALVIALLIFFLREGKVRTMIPGFILLLVMLPFMAGVFRTKSQVRTTSTGDDIMQVLTDLDNISAYSFRSGTFTFRIAMLAERIQYLADYPEYAPLGVGAIHEDSPNCYNRFDFILGTSNEDKVGDKCQIDSGDIAWGPVVLRYGWVGTLLHLAFFVVLLIISWRGKGAVTIIFPIFILYFINTFDSVFFEAGFPIFFSCLMMGWHFRESRETA